MLIGGALAVLAVAVGLMLMAFNQDIRFFRTPADLTEQEITSGARFRLGGLVEEGSVVREGSELRFTVTDTIKTVKVVFEGIAPDLSVRAKGLSRKAASVLMACFGPIMCSPNTMKIMFRKTSPTV